MNINNNIAQQTCKLHWEKQAWLEKQISDAAVLASMLQEKASA